MGVRKIEVNTESQLCSLPKSLDLGCAIVCGLFNLMSLFAYHCMINTMLKSYLGEERVYLILHFKITEGVRAGQEAETMNECGLQVVSHGLLSLLSYINRTTCPRVTPPTVGEHVGTE